MKYLVYTLALLVFMSCSNEMLVRDSFQKSVVIVTTDGSAKDGTVIDISSTDVVFIDGNSKKSERIKIENIVSVTPSENFYDSRGYEIAEQHIAKYKESTNTILYSAIGAIGGGLVGGLGLGLTADGDGKESIVTGLLIGGIGGGVYGGIQGHKSDVRKAVEKVRLRREALYKIQDEKKGN